MAALKDFILGNKYLQSFYRKIHRFALKGMNYDRGHVPTVNGEPYAIDYFLQSVKKGEIPVLFDIGANRGQYLEMVLQKLVKRKIFIHCFEPQFSAYQTLEKRAVNKDNVSINNCALGRESGKVWLYKDSDQSELGSLYNANYDQYNKVLSLKEEIQIMTLDSYCDENKISRIDFLKIDVEGHEFEVLKGGERMISEGRIHFIQFEFGLASIESRIFLKDFFTFLKDYQLYRILPKSLERLEYTEFLEIFLTTNYLAIRK